MTEPIAAVLDGPRPRGSSRARWPGFALIVAVTVIVLALPPVDGRRVPGWPVPIHLPGPPSIGECLQPVTPGASSAGFPRFGSCDSGTALGEVVTVRFRAAGEAGPPADQECAKAIADYAGLLVRGAGFGPVGASVESLPWLVPFEPADRWVPQAPGLPAGTSGWDACVASPPTTWQVGSLADAYAGGRLPAGYGRCWVARNPESHDAMIACAWPHTAELIGVVAGPDTAADRIDESCWRLAAELLARPDPTVNGALAVGVGSGDPLDDGTSTTSFCYLASTDHRLVDGSFVGLGESAISYFGS